MQKLPHLYLNATDSGAIESAVYLESRESVRVQRRSPAQCHTGRVYD